MPFPLSPQSRLEIGPDPRNWSGFIAKNSGTILVREERCQIPKKKFSDEQIAFALRQADGGAAVGEICRKMNIAEATFYRWKKIYAGIGVAEIRRLKQLEDENSTSCSIVLSSVRSATSRFSFVLRNQS